MDKHNVIYTYNGILFSLTQEGYSDIVTAWVNLEDMLNEMSQLQKRQILCESTYMRYIRTVKIIETESRVVDVRGFGEGE